MRDYSSMVFSLDNYKNENEMYEAIGHYVKILMDNDYICKIKREAFSIVVVEFNYDEAKTHYGCDELVWLSQDEIEALENIRQSENEEN